MAEGQLSKKQFLEFIKDYTAEEYQAYALEMLYDRVSVACPDIFNAGTDWILTYQGKLHKAPSPEKANKSIASNLSRKTRLDG